MQVTQAAKGQSAFFRTNNGGYGTKWEAQQAAGVDVTDPTEVPQYKDLVSQSTHTLSRDYDTQIPHVSENHKLSETALLAYDLMLIDSC